MTQLGIDTYHNDPLTHLQITTRGFVEAVAELSQMGIPWLALGGGGYDVMAVARAWTLAYGVMLGVEWPDKIPEVFAQQHGVRLLRDSLTPDIPENVRRDARSYAEESIAEIKEQVFPLHGLGS